MSVSYVQKVLIRCPLLKKDEVVHLLETVFSGRLIHILFSSECCNSLIVLFLIVLGQKGALCNRWRRYIRLWTHNACFWVFSWIQFDNLSWLNACPKGGLVCSLRFLQHKTGWTQFLLLLCLNLWPFFLATGQSLWPPHDNLYTVQLFYHEYKWDMIQTPAHCWVKNDEHLMGIKAALLQVSDFTNKRHNCTWTVMV